MKKSTERKKNDDSDFEIKFWKDWLYGDIIERRELVQGLPILKEIVQVGKLPKKYQKHAIATLLNGFFEDLESAVYTKIEVDKRRLVKGTR